METIPVFKPLIEQSDINSVIGSLELGWLGMGAYVGQFESAVKDLIDAPDRHVVAVSTGHAALHLAMMLIDLKPGDEVITPSFNNIADFQAILAVGAKPVFCDIKEDTLCIDMEKAELLVTSNTKAIIVMDYDCCLVDYDAVERFAKKHKVRVIHDAAHSFGSYFRNKRIGSFSDICMFSFDPVKTITCIDGGALVVKTQQEVELLHEMRLIGMGQPASVMYENKRAWSYDVKRLGFRYHMANTHGAIGLSQIKKMPEITKTRQETCQLYNKLLEPISEVRTPISSFLEVTPFLYYIRVPSSKRQALRDYLKENGVDTGIHWQPGHTFSLLANMKKGDLSVTEKIYPEILSLPLHSKMPPESVKFICSKISDFFGDES